MDSTMGTSRRINLNFEDFLVFVCVGVAEIACMMMVSKLLRTRGGQKANKSG